MRKFLLSLKDKSILLFKYRYLVFLFIILAAAVIGTILVKKPFSLRSKASFSDVTLNLWPQSIKSEKDQEFGLMVSVSSPYKSVSGVELNVNYDQTKLELEKITPKDFLPVVLLQPNISSGTGTITLGSEPDKPKKGTGIIATLTFKVLTKSPTQITYANSKVAVVESDDNAMNTTVPVSVNSQDVGGGEGGGNITLPTLPPNTITLPSPSGWDGTVHPLPTLNMTPPAIVTPEGGRKSPPPPPQGGKIQILQVP